jgi:glucose-1-phosphate thymidylyltransferase
MRAPVAWQSPGAHAMTGSSRPDEIVGLMPAAGAARRLGALPVSKEILPVGVEEGADGEPVVRVACHSLLAAFAAGGVARAVVVLREGKEDVARYLGPAYVDSAGARVPLAYQTLPSSPSLPASLDAAYPLVRGARVALGFPDVQLRPVDAFAHLAARQTETGADLALGLVAADRPSATDMVELDADGRVMRVEVRPSATALRWCWIVAVWGPRFTEHLHAQVAAEAVAAAGAEAARELQIGAVVAAAVAAGLDVRGVPLPGGSYLDVGTPAGLRAAWRM